MEDWKGPIFRQPTCLPGQLERLEKDCDRHIIVRSAHPGTPERAYLKFAARPEPDEKYSLAGVHGRLEASEVAPEHVWVHLLTIEELEALEPEYAEHARGGHGYALYISVEA